VIDAPTSTIVVTDEISVPQAGPSKTSALPAPSAPDADDDSPERPRKPKKRRLRRKRRGRVDVDRLAQHRKTAIAAHDRAAASPYEPHPPERVEDIGPIVAFEHLVDVADIERVFRPPQHSVHQIERCVRSIG